MNTLLERLQWRYATKKYDPSRHVPAEVVERILEAIRLAPTSSGLQPFELFVVTNAQVRARIHQASFGQAQTVEASHLLVFAAWDDVTPERLEQQLALTDSVRGPNPTFAAYRDRLRGLYAGRSREANAEHAARQAYIGLCAGLVAAAFEGVDSTPMEGFEPAAVDEILGLPARGLRSVALLALGYRDSTGDWLAGLKKVRRARADFVNEVA